MFNHSDIVAYAKWDFPVMLTAEEQEEKRILEASIRGGPPPDGANESLMKDFYNQKYAVKGKWHNPATDYGMFDSPYDYSVSSLRSELQAILIMS